MASNEGSVLRSGKLIGLAETAVRDEHPVAGEETEDLKMSLK